MRKTLANDPSKPGRQLSPDAKLDGRPAHSEAESVAEMSNLTARRAYNVTLESKVKDLATKSRRRSSMPKARRIDLSSCSLRRRSSLER